LIRFKGARFGPFWKSGLGKAKEKKKGSKTANEVPNVAEGTFAKGTGGENG